MLELDGLVRDIDQGLIPAAVYSDPDLFALERRRVFGRAWVLLAHTSEIPDPGDYVVRRIVDDSFIVCRDEHGTVQVLFNMCLHRGMQVCRAERGNTSHFRCPYHAWTYKNTGDLAGVPFHNDAYGGDEGLRREQVRLLSPRVDTYGGLIFASMDPDASPLRDQLGDFCFYLDFYLSQSPDGAEVHGPQRFVIDANWKIAAENFSGDSYHTPHTHASVVDINLFSAPKAGKRKEGAIYFAGGGGGTTYKLPDGAGYAANLAAVGYPPEMIERMARTWDPAQLAMVGDAGYMPSAATAMPNLSFVHNWPIVDEAGTVVPFISLRLWQPIDATRTEVFSWFVVDRHAPDWYKAASYKAYLMCFGSSGMFEQDDVENWVSITHMAKGQMAERLNLNSRMGLTRDGGLVKPEIDWPAPGRAFKGFGEHNQRELLRWWAMMLTEAPPGDAGRGDADHSRRATIE